MKVLQTTSHEQTLVGQCIGEWHLLALLGEGGMSSVYLGRSHENLQRFAAIKLLRPELSKDAEARQRFQLEAKTAGKINHGNIVEMYDFGQTKGERPYIAMELLAGVDLDSLIEGCPYPISWIRGIVLQICSALQATHEAGILHRDLKPSNIFLLPGHPPHVKLLDFGVAKMLYQEHKSLTRTGVIIGTPAYLAPEQVTPKELLTHSADIYALGVLLYQLLTGQLPIEGESLIEHAIQIVQQSPPLLGELRPEFAGSRLERVITQMLSKMPEHRPFSVEEAGELLQQAFYELNDPLEEGFVAPEISVPSWYEQVEEIRYAPEDFSFAPFSMEELSSQTSEPNLLYATYNSERSTTNLTDTDPQVDGKPVEKTAVQAYPSSSHDTSTWNSSSERSPSSSLLVAPIQVELEDSSFDGIQTPHSGYYATPVPETQSASYNYLPQAANIPSAHDLRSTDMMPAVEASDIEPSKKSENNIVRYMLFGLCLVFVPLTVTLGALTLFFRNNPQTQTEPQLTRLAIQGDQAFQRKEYKQAVQIWKKAIRLPSWKQSSYYPQLYKRVGVSLARLDRIHGAVRYYRKYFKVKLKQKQLSRKQRQAVQQELRKLRKIESDLRLRLAKGKTLLARSRKALKQGLLKESYQLYQALQTPRNFNPPTQMRLAAQLAPFFPTIAIRIYQNILAHLEPDRATRAKAQTAIQVLTEQMQQAEKETQQVLEQLKKSKNTIAKDVQVLEEKLKTQQHWYLPQVHKSFQSWLQWQLQHAPQKAEGYFSYLAKKLKELEQNGASLWLQKEPGIFRQEALQKQRQRLRLLDQTERNLRRSQKLMEQGKAQEALTLYKGILRKWQELQTTQKETPTQEDKTPTKNPLGWPKHWPISLETVQQRVENLKKLPQLRRSLSRHFVQGSTRKFQEYRKQILSLFPDKKIQRYYRRKFAQQLEKLRQADQLLQRAENSYHIALRSGKFEHWTRANTHFKKYLALFPNTRRRNWLQKRIHVCECGLGVTWKRCPSKKRNQKP